MAQHAGLGQSEFVMLFAGLGASIMNKMLKGNQINNKRLRFMGFFREHGKSEEERKNSGCLQLTRLYSASSHGCEEKTQCTPMLDQLGWALPVKLKKTRRLQDK